MSRNLAGADMLTKSELTRTCVAVTVQDSSGRHVVNTRRGRGGQVDMACTCTVNAEKGWCGHQLDLLCLRYDAVVEQDSNAEFHFEDIILGTALADTADEVDVAIAAYRDALAAIERYRSSDLSAEGLSVLADEAAELSAASRALATALGRLRRKLETARTSSLVE